MVEFFLDNQPINAPIEWQDLSIQVNFEDSVQPIVDATEYTFVDDAAKQIIAHIQGGLTGGVGIFEGMPFSISIEGCVLFDGFLHFKNQYIQEGCYKVTCTTQKSKGLTTLDECLEANTYGYLKQIGLVKNSDIVKVPYVVEKIEYGIEFFMLSLTTYLLFKETAEAIKSTNEQVKEQIEAAIPVGGVPSPNFPKIATVALTAAINAIYIATMTIYLVQLITDLLDYIYSPVRNHRAMKFKKMLSIAAQHCGYGFETSIDELDNLYHIPSRTEGDDNTGIPTPQDRTYRLSQAFALAKDLFDVKIAIVNDVVQMHPANSPYWIKASTYELPDVLNESIEFNTKEVLSNRIFSFATDLRDGWTIESYRGTSFGVNTRPNHKVNESNVIICGFEDIQFGVALGNRKTGLTDFEKAVKVVAQIADGLINLFGGGSNLSSKVKNRVGMLKQENRTHSIAKLVYLNEDLKLPNGHKDLFSAKVLYNKYNNRKSFVLNNYGYQKRLFNNVRIPFCLDDYKKVLDNSYFTVNGKVGKIVSLQWSVDNSYADISYWIQEVYTTNLKEVYVEET